MSGTTTDDLTCAVVLRLQQAINAHETPVRTARSFDAALAAQFGAR